MPILIKELHVKINVDNDKNEVPTKRSNHNNKEKIVAECVEQVMDIMSNLKER